MSSRTPSKRDLKRIDVLVQAFLANRDSITLFLEQLRSALTESRALTAHVHSMKWRVKDPDHLRDKLLRKLRQAHQDGTTFDITPDSLMVRVNDLAGIRLLHLHTRQIVPIDSAIREIIEEQRYSLQEGPFARTWDDESRTFFSQHGIQTQSSPTMYTSVHYVVGSASRTLLTCEVQVRTLMEEVWGEVDHAINYPQRVESLPCREQIKVLARVTSSASRLVDAIFLTHEDHRGVAEEHSEPTAGRTSPRARNGKRVKRKSH